MPPGRIVCIVGPTATGKTALAIDVAEAIGGEIVSVDSRQIYRGLDIGTAKPTAAERRRVRHHCLDLVEADATFDAARYRAAAGAALDDLVTRRRAALVVGGTGMWLRVLLRGLCPAPPRAPVIRAALRAVAAGRGPGALHRYLRALDPPAAARIHPHDAVRLERALEVAFASGRRLSEWQAAHRGGPPAWDALVIGLSLPAAALDLRIAARAQRMVAAGFADEVRALRRRGVPDTAPAWASVGYREMRAHVDGACDLPTAVAAVVSATRRFAKRQRTWFRAEHGIVWSPPDAPRASVVAAVRAFLDRGERPPPDPARVANPPAPG